MIRNNRIPQRLRDLSKSRRYTLCKLGSEEISAVFDCLPTKEQDVVISNIYIHPDFQAYINSAAPTSEFGRFPFIVGQEMSESQLADWANKISSQDINILLTDGTERQVPLFFSETDATEVTFTIDAVDDIEEETVEWLVDSLGMSKEDAEVIVGGDLSDELTAMSYFLDSAPFEYTVVD